MLSQAEIIKALQFARFYDSDPMNSTGAPRLEITYQYAGTQQPGDLPTDTTYSGWRDFTTAEKANFETALAHIESFLNVEFTEVSGEDDPDINVGAVTLSGNTSGYGGYGVSFFDTTITEWDGFVVFDESRDLSSADAMNLLLHELGHAMGLRHTFDPDANLPEEYDSNLYSIMSYTTNPINGQDSGAMMLFDVLALQDIWGSADYNTGDTRYTGSRTNTVDAIWDSGGEDTIFGQRGSDQLEGGASRDRLFGQGGRDDLEGNAGRDVLRGGNSKDFLSGGGHRDRLFGGNGNDTLKGNGGNDILNGQSGNDRLFGGRGDDKFVFNNSFGNDTIRDFADDLDSLEITGHGDQATLLAAASDTDKGVLFDFGADTLLVKGITLADISDDILI
ncbi:matrixin family metalloprotease [Phaeobacter sp. CAU 1743]|uniref:matrixin family metalloprotease n=1 Tax=Phaeobacter sp. CAU 1743 TaxID=3140367 RepID=UPI0023B55DF2